MNSLVTELAKELVELGWSLNDSSEYCCKSCKTAVEINDKYCSNCGKKLTPDTSSDALDDLDKALAKALATLSLTITDAN